jgi:replication factor C small subunit
MFIDKYRPKELDEFVLDPYIKTFIEKAIEKQKIQHTIFYGTSGVGKSSLIQFLCSKIADDVLIINASDERGIDVIREKIIPFASSVSFSDKLKIVDFREADQLTKDSQKALNDVIEAYSSTTIFLFSTNDIHKLLDSIKSRCAKIRLSGGTPQDCINVLKKIVINEGISINPQDAKKIVQENYPDIRQMINVLEQGLDENNVYTKIDKTLEKQKLIECINVISNKVIDDNDIYNRYTQIRLILNTLDQIEIDNSFRILTENVDSMFKNNFPRMEAVIIISEYMYRNSVNLDKLINLSTLFIQLLKIKKEDA